VSAADIVATLRALAVIPVAWAIVAGRSELALGVFVLAALSDALDGWLARRTGTLGPRGELLDPLADKVLVIGTLVALVSVGSGWPVTVVTVLVALREGLVAYLRARAFARGTALPADRIAKLKTVGEMIGVALIIVGGRPWAVLGAGLVGVAFLVGIAVLPRYVAARLA